MIATTQLPELLMQTGVDRTQAAHLTGLPPALVAGCADVFDGLYLDADATRRMTEADRADYVRGQRIADAWFQAELCAAAIVDA